ncbi:MAG: hypothetical protein LBC13_01910 [Clostridiales bacterium]|jgi:hypothetical protein|nr:hypothetical protein [Clostridiales bacterium]
MVNRLSYISGDVIGFERRLYRSGAAKPDLICNNRKSGGGATGLFFNETGIRLSVVVAKPDLICNNRKSGGGTVGLFFNETGIRLSVVAAKRGGVLYGDNKTRGSFRRS